MAVDVVALPKPKPPDEAVDVAGVEPKLKPEEEVAAAGAPKPKPVDAGAVEVAVAGVDPKLNPEDEVAGALPKPPKPEAAGAVDVAAAGVAPKENEDEPVDVEMAAGALLPKLKPPVAAGAAGVVPKEKPAEDKTPRKSVNRCPQNAINEPQRAQTQLHANNSVIFRTCGRRRRGRAAKVERHSSGA